jgi:hypothetical protein
VHENTVALKELSGKTPNGQQERDGGLNEERVEAN